MVSSGAEGGQRTGLGRVGVVCVSLYLDMGRKGHKPEEAGEFHSNFMVQIERKKQIVKRRGKPTNPKRNRNPKKEQGDSGPPNDPHSSF